MQIYYKKMQNLTEPMDIDYSGDLDPLNKIIT